MAPHILFALIFTCIISLVSSSTIYTCPKLRSKSSPPIVAHGYSAQLVAIGLTTPRGIRFDSFGNLLVVERGVGVTVLNFTNLGQGCLIESSRRIVIAEPTLNHGIELAPDGKTIYASNSEKLFSWAYSPHAQRNLSGPTTLIENMSGTDHTTRTLLLSKKVFGTIIVSRGSDSNIDPQASDIHSGHSQIKSFDLRALGNKTYDFNTDGKLLGWGMRNDVGVGEHPVTGGIYAVENSADNIVRQGVDIHQNNPGEKLNFLGYLNGKFSPNQGRNFGYPECFSAWNLTELPNFNGSVGEQFAIGDLTSTNNDAFCAQRQAPRLTFQAHMAPLDIIFNLDGSSAYITFHGSWDRTQPTGYKVGRVEFSHGEPVQPSTSTTSLTDILSNANNSACNTGPCLRPVGLAYDYAGRLFVSSDATGEIWVITRNKGTLGGWFT